MSETDDYDNLYERVDVSNTEDVWYDGFWRGYDTAKRMHEILAERGN